MSVYDTSFCYTTVKNNTATAQTYSFLEKNGRTLAAGATLQVLGHLASVLAADQSPRGKTRQQAFISAVQQNLIKILSTPNPVLMSPDGTAQRQLGIDNSSVVTITPVADTILV